MLKNWIQARSRTEWLIIAVAVLWNVATMAVMFADRPDWALMMIVPYGYFACTYEEETKSE